MTELTAPSAPADAWLIERANGKKDAVLSLPTDDMAEGDKAHALVKRDRLQEVAPSAPLPEERTVSVRELVRLLEGSAGNTDTDWRLPEPKEWNKADHHASCRPSDSRLVWQCGQCGHVAAADDIDARLQDEIATVQALREHIAKQDEVFTAKLTEINAFSCEYEERTEAALAAAERRLQDEIAKREGAERDYEACRELLSVHNLGGMTDYNDGPMKRALAAESRAAALQKELEAVRKDAAMFRSIANSEVVVTRMEGGFIVRRANESGLDSKSWHAGKTLAEAIDAALSKESPNE
jgi:hypothetical protein